LQRRRIFYRIKVVSFDQLGVDLMCLSLLKLNPSILKLKLIFSFFPSFFHRETNNDAKQSRGINDKKLISLMYVVLKLFPGDGISGPLRLRILSHRTSIMFSVACR